MLYGEEYRLLIVRELLELPRHLEFDTAPDCVEFGSNYNDLTNCAILMSRTLWFPADFIKHGAAGAKEVAPGRLRNVQRGLLDYTNEIAEAKAQIALHGEREDLVAELNRVQRLDGHVFVKFELAYPGRTSRDMRTLFHWYHTRRLALDKRYNDVNLALTTLVAHYLDARDAKKAMDVKHMNASGQVSINVGFAEAAQ